MKTVALAAGLLLSVTSLTAAGALPADGSSQSAPVSGEKKPKAYLGLDFRWQRDASRARFLHVERVAPRGPAQQAGLRPGDIITHIGGVPVGFGDELDFLIFMRDRHPGERLVMSVVRSGKTLKLVATLGALPEAARVSWEEGFRMAQQKRMAARAQRR